MMRHYVAKSSVKACDGALVPHKAAAVHLLQWGALHNNFATTAELGQQMSVSASAWTMKERRF